MTKIKQSAFTLAEVLITLGIIGVVAALTIPNLITNYQKQETIEGLKKAYNMLENAQSISENDNGPSSTWDYTLNTYNFMTTYYDPYLKIIKKGTSSSNAFGQAITYKNMSGGSFGGDNNGFNYWIGLADGTIISAMSNSQFIVIRADINGLKKPNTIGKDVFDFEAKWNSPKKLTAMGKDVTPSNRTAYLTGYNCYSHDYNGGGPSYCGAVIQYDGWKISDDYPW